MILTMICPCCHQRFKIEAVGSKTENTKIKPPHIGPEQMARLNKVARVICDYFDISLSELKSATRKREIVLARHYFFYLCMRYTKTSPAKIGFYCGGRDRTTIYNGETAIENLKFTKHRDVRHLEPLLEALQPEIFQLNKAS